MKAWVIKDRKGRYLNTEGSFVDTLKRVVLFDLFKDAFIYAVICFGELDGIDIVGVEVREV